MVKAKHLCRKIIISENKLQVNENLFPLSGGKVKLALFIHNMNHFVTWLDNKKK